MIKFPKLAKFTKFAKFSKFSKFFLPLIVVITLAALFLVNKIGATQRQVEQQNNDFDQKLLLLEGRLAKIEENLGIVTEKTDAETERRETIIEQSQEELLTAAVAKISPAVVSIVISKEVPKLEIVYENPFGDDPFFKDFDVKIPVWRQKGTETQNVGAGTGFLINSNGYILTNCHVVEDTEATYTILLTDGSQKEASVIYRDTANDAAVLKIAGVNYTVAELGDSAGLVLGQSVFAVGNALGEYSNSVSVGIISGLNRIIEATTAAGTVEKLNGVIQTDAAINAGNSGGPLVDLQGKVIGINVATVVGSNNISFSIPINTIKSAIQNALK